VAQDQRRTSRRPEAVQYRQDQSGRPREARSDRPRVANGTRNTPIPTGRMDVAADARCRVPQFAGSVGHRHCAAMTSLVPDDWPSSSWRI